MSGTNRVWSGRAPESGGLNCLHSGNGPSPSTPSEAMETFGACLECHVFPSALSALSAEEDVLAEVVRRVEELRITERNAMQELKTRVEKMTEIMKGTKALIDPHYGQEEMDDNHGQHAQAEVCIVNEDEVHHEKDHVERENESETELRAERNVRQENSNNDTEIDALVRVTEEAERRASINHRG